jgi:hypothetical protein
VRDAYFCALGKLFDGSEVVVRQLGYPKLVQVMLKFLPQPSPDSFQQIQRTVVNAISSSSALATLPERRDYDSLSSRLVNQRADRRDKRSQQQKRSEAESQPTWLGFGSQRITRTVDARTPVVQAHQEA